MKLSLVLVVIAFSLCLPKIGTAQINQDKLGAWYMYFFNTTFKESPW
ncbi:MAG: hypothetical protein ACI857_002608, partial [Arenicella sp.]